MLRMGLGSRDEWYTCWWSSRRSLAAISALIDLCGELLPNDLGNDARGILETFCERHRRHDVAAKARRRGAILAVEDIAAHLQLLLRLKTPVFVLAA